MNGKMTTSRMGIIGNRRVSDFSLDVSMEELSVFSRQSPVPEGVVARQPG
jgi:hypothetical protein